MRLNIPSCGIFTGIDYLAVLESPVQITLVSLILAVNIGEFFVYAQGNNNGVRLKNGMIFFVQPRRQCQSLKSLHSGMHQVIIKPYILQLAVLNGSLRIT